MENENFILTKGMLKDNATDLQSAVDNMQNIIKSEEMKLREYFKSNNINLDESLNIVERYILDLFNSDPDRINNEEYFNLKIERFFNNLSLKIAIGY